MDMVGKAYLLISAFPDCQLIREVDFHVQKLLPQLGNRREAFPQG